MESMDLFLKKCEETCLLLPPSKSNFTRCKSHLLLLIPNDKANKQLIYKIVLSLFSVYVPLSVLVFLLCHFVFVADNCGSSPVCSCCCYCSVCVCLCFFGFIYQELYIILLLILGKCPRTPYVCAGQSGSLIRHGCACPYPFSIFAKKPQHIPLLVSPDQKNKTPLKRHSLYYQQRNDTNCACLHRCRPSNKNKCLFSMSNTNIRCQCMSV